MTNLLSLDVKIKEEYKIDVECVVAEVNRQIDAKQYYSNMFESIIDDQEISESNHNRFSYEEIICMVVLHGDEHECSYLQSTDIRQLKSDLEDKANYIIHHSGMNYAREKWEEITEVVEDNCLDWDSASSSNSRGNAIQLKHEGNADYDEFIFLLNAGDNTQERWINVYNDIFDFWFLVEELEDDEKIAHNYTD